MDVVYGKDAVEYEVAFESQDEAMMVVCGGEVDGQSVETVLAALDEMGIGVAGVVCADSGIDRWRDLVAHPQDGGEEGWRLGRLGVLGVVGDMDSAVSGKEVGEESVWIEMKEQDTTDVMKTLRVVSAPLVFGFGLGGSRMDHVLASLTALAGCSHPNVVFCYGSDIVFRLPCPRLELTDLPPNTRVSLYPLGTVAGLSSTGLKWPLDDLVFHPSRLIGTSNVLLPTFTSFSITTSPSTSPSTSASTTTTSANEGRDPMLVILPRTIPVLRSLITFLLFPPTSISTASTTNQRS